MFRFVLNCNKCNVWFWNFILYVANVEYLVIIEKLSWVSLFVWMKEHFDMGIYSKWKRLSWELFNVYNLQSFYLWSSHFFWPEQNRSLVLRHFNFEDPNSLDSDKGCSAPYHAQGGLSRQPTPSTKIRQIDQIWYLGLINEGGLLVRALPFFLICMESRHTGSAPSTGGMHKGGVE